ncbi:MAG TPA: NAD(P)H-binding protein, partial [Solirubrobacterales bacterium]|nr:NAD(P)H-binding protein [Solirubrobacterales bacterium]
MANRHTWPMPSPRKLCLVTGATGYIGGRLVPELLAAGYRVRVLSRHPDRLRDVAWFDEVEVVRGDAGEPDQVREALRGVDVAYYLLHS